MVCKFKEFIIFPYVVMRKPLKEAAFFCFFSLVTYVARKEVLQMKKGLIDLAPAICLQPV